MHICIYIVYDNLSHYVIMNKEPSMYIFIYIHIDYLNLYVILFILDFKILKIILYNKL